MVLAHEDEHLRAWDPLILGALLLPLVALPWNLRCARRWKLIATVASLRVDWMSAPTADCSSQSAPGVAHTDSRSPCCPDPHPRWSAGFD